MTFREICKKQVVQTVDGVCLGRVDDLELDESGKNIRAFILYGAPRLFGLLGREPNLTIPIEEVQMFGVDVLLVTTNAVKPQAEPGSPTKWLSGLFS